LAVSRNPDPSLKPGLEGLPLASGLPQLPVASCAHLFRVFVLPYPLAEKRPKTRQKTEESPLFDIAFPIPAPSTNAPTPTTATNFLLISGL
jgi:hypothetical protein